MSFKIELLQWLFFKNYLAGQENEDCITYIPDNIGLSQTANLPVKLKLCVGARVMLTYHSSVSDGLVNGSIAKALK